MRIIVFLAAVMLAVSCGHETEVETILRGHVIYFNEPSQRIPSQCSVDAPLLGNGYTGVALSGTPDSFVFRFARNDFWRL